MATLKPPNESLSLISTHWPTITDATKFVLRYAPAIRGYLQMLLSQPADVDEALQDILVTVVQRGFTPDRVHRGRFRDYLIAAVRYSAWRTRRRARATQLNAAQADGLIAPAVAGEEAAWLADWRQCLLDRAWDRLECRQRLSPGNWHYTVLKLTADHPDASSKQLATQVAAAPPLSPAAFRKQLSRARVAFARALVHEVERTLEKPTPDSVMEELAELGLLEHVQRYFRC